MSDVLLDQTLHGYTEGHGLIAASPGVSAEERALLDRLSDLSGYLPAGLSFDRYHTGFPCGRYYALGCTWPDTSAPRGGAVMTHSVLIPRRALGQPDILDRAWKALRRPASPKAHGYDQRVELPGQAAPLPELRGDRARAAIALLFGSAARPIVWVDAARPEDVVRGLWSLLWPEAREEFSFCTLALAPRQIGGRVFTLLGVPPEARGSFSNLAAHPAWWDLGRLRDPQAVTRMAEPWVDQVLGGGAPLIAAVVGRARTAGLRVQPEDLPLFLRLDELARSAPDRLTAARAYADLLANRLPKVPATHPWWSDALTALLARQREAPVKPKPLWDLTDLLSRPQAQELARDHAFRDRLEDVVVAELARRLQDAPRETCDGLPALLTAAQGVPGMGDALGPALGRAVSRARDIDQAVGVAAAVISRIDSVDAAADVLAPLPEEARVAAVSASQAGGFEETLAQRLLAVAERLPDLRVAYALGDAEGGPPVGLARAAQVAVRSDPALFAQFERLLTTLPPDVSFTWALANTELTLEGVAKTAGARAARQLGLRLADVGARILGQPGGPAIFLDAARGATRDELLGAVTATPALGMLVLERATADRSTELTRALAQGLPGMLATGALRPPDAATWLASAPLRDALSQSSRWNLFPTVGRPGPNLLVPLVESARLLPRDVSLHPLVELLALALQAADRAGLENSTEGLVALLSGSVARDDKAILQGEILGAVARLRPSSGPALILPCFPGVYPAVRDGARFPFNLLSWWFDADWDRAKRWRHWLVDAWLEEGWAPVELIRVIDATAGSEKLFAQVTKRAWKSRQGEAMMRRALADLGAAPELSRWRQPLERLLHEGPPWVDYE